MNPARSIGLTLFPTPRKKIRNKYKHFTDNDAELHLEKGNSLLASMGSLGRDFFKMISAFDSRTYEQYEDPVGQDVLSGIQSDILLCPKKPGPLGQVRDIWLCRNKLIQN